MSADLCHAWLVSYDISDRRRLGRVYRFLLKQATPIQYSVFLFEGTRKRLESLLAGIAELMAEQQDDVRAYQLPGDARLDSIGERRLPAEVMLLSGRMPILQRLLHQGQ